MEKENRPCARDIIIFIDIQVVVVVCIFRGGRSSGSGKQVEIVEALEEGVDELGRHASEMDINK